ncbi:MAG: VCBS domain-containing protein, partial [Caryophanon sp.]|nr:VCBS domain-containing protein [Caryophanon sp.]
PSEQWTTPKEKVALEDVIAEARDVLGNTNTTQEEVDAVKEALEDAVAAYEAAKKPGTKEEGGTPIDPGQVDKTALGAAINEATNGKVAMSSDGEDVPVGTKWTTEGDLDTFEAAIEAAQSVFDNEAASEEEVAKAIVDLEAASVAYVAAQEDGKKAASGEVDKSALENAITAADDSKVAMSSDGEDVPVGTKWTTEEDLDTFEAAIEAAQSVFDNEAASEEEVGKAIDDLEAASLAYQQAQADGQQEPIAAQDVIDTIALNYTGSVKTNKNIGELVVGESVTEINIVQLQLLQIIDAGVISQLGNNALEFTVEEGETLNYSFNTTIQAVLGTGGYSIGLYKKQEDGQYKLMDQNSFTYLTVLGVPIQTAYDFSFTNIKAGEYVMATFPSGTVNAEALSAVTTTIMSTSLSETAELINVGSQTASTTDTIELTRGATITSVTPKSIGGATATTNVATIQGAYGTLTLDAETGEYTYTSNGAREAIGKVDVFEYTVGNGEETATATLYIQHDVVDGDSVVKLRWNENNPATDAILAESATVTNEVVINALDENTNQVLANLSGRTTVGDNPLIIETNPSEVPAPGAETEDTVGHLFVKGTDSILTFRPVIPVGSYGFPPQNFVVNYKVEKVDLETGQASEVWSGNVGGTKLPGVAANDIHLRNLERGYYRITAARVSTGLTAMNVYGIQNVKVTDVNWAADEVTSSQPIITTDAQAVTGNVGYLAPGGNIQVEGTTILSGQAAAFSGDYGTLVMNSDGTYTYNVNPSLVNKTAPGKTETFTYTLVDVHGNVSAPQTITINLVAGQTYSIPNPSTGQIITVTQAIPTASIEPLRYSVVDNALAIATTVDASILS